MGAFALAKLDPSVRRVAAPTFGYSLAIVVSVVALDFLVNTVLMPGLVPYTPIASIFISLLVAPPYVLAMRLKIERVRRAEQALAQEHAARVAAEAIQDARTRFFANTSHELRTPLNGIIGYSEFMLEGALKDARTQDAADHQKVLSAAHRLLALLNDLLDLAKIDAGKMQLDHRNYDIAETIHEAVDLVRPAIAHNRNRLVVEIDASLTTGRSDPMRIGQCLLNLLSNAAKFTSDGLVQVTARRERDAAGDWLTIAVADTGVGVAPERQAILFEPFMQAAAQKSGTVRGTGLGLAITRQIATLLGGSVAMQSAPGKGSTFTLRLPLGEAVAEPALDHRIAAAVGW